MKKNNYISIVLMLFAFGFASLETYGQISDENTIAISQYFQNSNSSRGLEEKAKETKTHNFAKYNSITNIVQVGNYNYTNINSNANSLGVQQEGNNNNYEFMTYYGRDDLNIDVQQIGNNNSIQVFGENKIIDNLKIVQKSNFKTITITNY